MTHDGAVCGCITCGDAATAMRVVRLDVERGLGLCEASDGRRSAVELALVGQAGIGDTLLVHAGVAIARLEEPEAGR